MSEQEKKDKSNCISKNFKVIIDSIFPKKGIHTEQIKYWSVNSLMLKPSSSIHGALELPYSFDVAYSNNPREYYTFEGIVYAEQNSLEILKNDSNQFLVEINAIFKGDDGKSYTVDYLTFPEFSKSSSIVSEFDKSLNIPLTKYSNHVNTQKEKFINGMSENEKAIALLEFRERDYHECTFRFNENWLEIIMTGSQYPINAGNPETACQLFFEENKEILKYCTGIRIFNKNHAKRGSYRNPNDKYNP